jgi:hypothetical protein
MLGVSLLVQPAPPTQSPNHDLCRFLATGWDAIDSAEKADEPADDEETHRNPPRPLGLYLIPRANDFRFVEYAFVEIENISLEQLCGIVLCIQ